MANPGKPQTDAKSEEHDAKSEEHSEDPASSRESKSSGDTKPAGDSKESAASKPSGSTKPKTTTSKRVTPPKAKLEQSARYTAKGTQSEHKGPSPQWVPVLMFSLWAIGFLIIVLNYMTVLPGATAKASGWYLITGLILLLVGIVVATQYR
ncbi:MAG: cell division protein CrgA [Microthrixaceae bacterium]